MSLLEMVGSHSALRDLLHGTFVADPVSGRVGYCSNDDGDGRSFTIRVLDDSRPYPQVPVFGERIEVRANAFPDMGVLAYPKLGWREERDGNWIGTMWRNTSYRRGIRPSDNLRLNVSNFTRVMSASFAVRTSLSIEEQLRAAFYPNYIRMDELLAKLLAGERMAGVLSSDFAVLPRNSGGWHIVHGAHRAGTINARGRIEFSVPSSEKLFNKVS